VLSKTDEATGKPLVDVIADEAEQKGTGRWTAQDALERGVPLTSITEAVFARTLSAQRAERTEAANRLAGPEPGTGGRADRSLIDDIHHALYASKVVAYAQGFAQMATASNEESWQLDLGQLATIWRGGCIIRANFLDRIREAYDTDPRTPNLLFVDYFRKAVADAQESWRRVVAVAAEQGVAVPAFSSALAWYDGYRRTRGSANLIQGLRDYFGAHTYRRLDQEGSFHTRWAQDGREVRTDT
jgi:6-phosphogluconate dehydrogenase